jgi:AcrR family transcriptional regulator
MPTFEDSKELQPKPTRERILEAAMKIIAERGIGRLRIRELAREVGIREGSIYNHFESREAIVRELFESVEARLAPLESVFKLESASAEARTAIEVELRAVGLKGLFLGAKDYLVQGLAKDPSALKVIRALLGARFHDKSAQLAYEEVFLPDVEGIFAAFCALAAGLGLLRRDIEGDTIAALAGTAIERAFLSCYADEGLERFDELLTSLLGSLGVMASAAPAPD